MALSLFKTYVAVQESTLHVCADPAAAVAESVYPELHALQSTVASSHNVAPDPDEIVGVPLGQVHVLAEQANALKVPPILHVAVPPPVYPVLQVTFTVCPVVPIQKEKKNVEMVLDLRLITKYLMS